MKKSQHQKRNLPYYRTTARLNCKTDWINILLSKILQWNRFVMMCTVKIWEAVLNNILYNGTIKNNLFMFHLSQISICSSVVFFEVRFSCKLNVTFYECFVLFFFMQMLFSFNNVSFINRNTMGSVGRCLT